MAGEELARRIIQVHLGRKVVLHDSGKRDSMYDLRIGAEDSPEVAIEVVGAVDKRSTELWNIGPAEGPSGHSGKSVWTVVLRKDAVLRKVRTGIEPILLNLDERRIKAVHVNFRLEREEEELFKKLDALRVSHLVWHRDQEEGEYHLTIDGNGGPVDKLGKAVPAWIGEFLAHPKRTDVVNKLAHSGATRREAFVIAGLDGMPWAVEGYLVGDIEHLPSQAPILPEEIDAVWVSSGFSQKGIRWVEGRWEFFRTRGEGIDGVEEN